MIERILNKASSRLLTAEIIGLTLIIVALRAFTEWISSSLRSPDVDQSTYFFWVCLIAALITLGVGRLRLNGIHASIGMIVIGVVGIWIIGARLAYLLLDLGKASLTVV